MISLSRSNRSGSKACGLRQKAWCRCSTQGATITIAPRFTLWVPIVVASSATRGRKVMGG